MRNLWKVGALSAVFGAVLSVGGCSDFDAAYENCQGEGRCGPQASGDGGTDAGDSGDAGDAGDGGYDCIPTADPDYPDLTGFDNDCDGIDGVADAGYFVDPEGGKDIDNNGTRTQPFKTLARALQEIRDGGTGRNIVYLGTGTYTEAAPVVDMPVSLYGGYTWRGNEFWDRFKDGGGTTFFDGGALAFAVTNVTDGVVLLDALHIASAKGAADNGASIALKVLNSTDVQLRGTTLEAGMGGPGTDGVPGTSGADGGPGTQGEDGLAQKGGNPMVGGTNTCSPGGERTGGTSGPGLTRGDGLPGESGAPSPEGGDGGAGGPRGVVVCPEDGGP
ncbi:DUF1565 domain-containing protein, partial [Corallococcus exiguus]|uniref:DUF1565 domain-containing protein n=1 Tax=Corallococcus exiguus TaxID=83462 RepID=UPI001494767E